MYDKQPKYPTQYEESPKTINVPLRKYNELLKQRLINLNQIEKNNETIKRLESKLFWYRIATRFSILIIIVAIFAIVPKYNNLKKTNEALQDEYTQLEEYSENLKNKFSNLNNSYQILKDEYNYLDRRNESLSDEISNLKKSYSLNYTRYSNNSTSSYHSSSSNQNAVVEYYIGNKNSKIFHKNYCGSAAKMNDSNKIRFETEEEARNAGYRGCGNCNP